MPTRNVNLTEHLDTFIETGVASGRFSNASEVVREGLRLLEHRDLEDNEHRDLEDNEHRDLEDNEQRDLEDNEQRDLEDKAKLEWLRSAAKEGFDAADLGHFVALNSAQELDTFLDQIHEQVAAQVV